MKNVTEKELPDTHGELITISSHTGEGDYEPVEELSEFIDGKVNTSIEYARYWHGYLTLLRPLLLFFDITQIRFLLCLLFTALLAIIIVLLKKRFGIGIALIFAFALLAYDYFFVSYSLQGAPIFITMMVSCIILLLRIDKIKNIYLYFFVIGCIANFVDFLTVPLLTFAMPMFIYLLYKQRNENISCKNCIKLVLSCLILWGLGYAATWFSKWLIFDIFYGKNLISSAISQVSYRSSVTNSEVFPLLGIVFRNFLRIAIIYITIYLAAFGLFLMTFARKYIFKFEILHFSNYFKKTLPFLIVAICPFIWYTVLANHSVLHTYFIYRNMIIFLTGILICLKNSISIEKKINEKENNRIKIEQKNKRA